MEFSTPLVRGRLLQRYKRFLADIELESGEVITAHCANPGAMTGLKEPGLSVWLSKSDNPTRKLAYSWELVELPSGLVGINTAHPNRLVEEAIAAGQIDQLKGYQSLRREVKYGANSRIDLLLEDPAHAPCYVEIKNVHLMRMQGLHEFPDSVTARGAKHLLELSNMVTEGNRSVMVYLIQRDDGDRFSLAADIDPAYAKAFNAARDCGVEAIAYCCEVSPNGINVAHQVPIVD